MGPRGAFAALRRGRDENSEDVCVVGRTIRDEVWSATDHTAEGRQRLNQQRHWIRFGVRREGLY
jgi:DNA-binding transcriptional regulator/RsmH inhibitor MraZ